MSPRVRASSQVRLADQQPEVVVVPLQPAAHDGGQFVVQVQPQISGQPW